MKEKLRQETEEALKKREEDRVIHEEEYRRKRLETF